jgi:hypothetical protein
MHLPAGLLASLSQRLEQLLTINIIEKNVLAPVPSIHDVQVSVLTIGTAEARC